MGKHRAPRATPTPSARAALPALRTVVVSTAAGGGALGAVAAALAPAALAATPPAPGPFAAPHLSAVLVAVPGSARFARPSDAELAALRGCESGGSYAIATGNGYYGAYQFDLGTWRSLGLSGYPNQASPQLQDAAAAALMQARGWGPWPSCSSRLGLVARSPAAPVAAPVAVPVAAPDTAPAAAPTRSVTTVAVVAPIRARHRLPLGTGPTSVPTVRPPVTVTAAPAFAGRLLSVVDIATYRSDVRLWQERMAQRGWTIAPDGHFGPQTQRVARAFAAEKGLSDGLPGEVGAIVWAAAWTAPVT